MKTLLALPLVLLLAGPAHAEGRHAPLGYQLMCLQHPAECRSGGPASIAPNAAILRLLDRVNLAVNRQITPRADRGADTWSLDAKAGDCEDYVLAKRQQLIAAGLPANALRIAYVKTRRGEGHAVLVVVAGSEHYVLDNLTSAIRPLARTGYRLVSMQGENPGIWG
jgi:predicted transglutaminase-like cysteine proteinase